MASVTARGKDLGGKPKHLSSVSLVLNLVRLCSLYKNQILYPKRRIQSYSRLGTIVSPNTTLLIWDASV